jgi:hypothetical protein
MSEGDASSPGKTSPMEDKDNRRNYYRHDMWESRNILQKHLWMEALTRGLENPAERDIGRIDD